MITIISRTKESTLIDNILIKGQGILNFVSETDWDRVYLMYKSYFDERIQTDKNPNGIYIVNDNRQYAIDQHKEVGNIKENIDETIEKIVDETIKEEAPHLVEAHKENKKRARKK